MATAKYTMTVDLSVLESLGINLYSNAAAVLSELVANAYDADATKVEITWEPGNRVVVTDNGSGMNVTEMNERFLTVGYKKRDKEGKVSKKFKRPFMGRKGIGKLSVFSIAAVVTVYSKKGRAAANGFQIDVDDLTNHIKKGIEYHPTDVPVPKEYQKTGTSLVLESVKSKRADLTVAALRKRLARRFDVLDNRPAKDGGFQILVNGNRLNWADRQELKHLEFIWEFGDEKLPATVLPSKPKRFALDGVVDAGKGWKVSGWFGSAKRPTDLTDDDEAGSLKNIIVLARKRPIQEGIIEKLDFSRIFGNYVTGQVQAEFLDLDDEEDIATSDRQRLIEDDPRVSALQKFLRSAFVKAAEDWSKERPKKEAKDALANYPKLKEWVETRDAYQRTAAEAMIGTIASLELEKGDEKARVELFRSGILAFERVALRKATADLEELSKVTAHDLLPLLGRQGEYEAGLWVDILRSRVEAISQFQNLANTNEKEKVLQEHLFHNLWLLDPAWERATDSLKLEEDLRKIDPTLVSTDKGGKKITGRIDIRYKTHGGRHVIVELKRYSVKTDIDKLVEQGGKYAQALVSVLKKQGDQDPKIEVVFVVGDVPPVKANSLQSDEEYRRNRLATINGRFVMYDELIANALRQYADYLNASDRAQKLEALLSSIEGK